MYLEKGGKVEISFINWRAKAVGGLACSPNTYLPHLPDAYLPHLPSMAAGCPGGHVRAAKGHGLCKRVTAKKFAVSWFTL